MKNKVITQEKWREILTELEEFCNDALKDNEVLYAEYQANRRSHTKRDAYFTSCHVLGTLSQVLEIVGFGVDEYLFKNKTAQKDGAEELNNDI